jgi:hypothetical protein
VVAAAGTRLEGISRQGATLTQLRGFALDFAECKKLLPYESVPGLWITIENRL